MSDEKKTKTKKSKKGKASKGEKPQKPPDGNVVIGSFKRNAAEEVRAQINTYRGRTYADLRVFYLSDSGEYLPTKKGIAISTDQVADLEKLVGKLTKAVAK
jgi:hypothetical protein